MTTKIEALAQALEKAKIKTKLWTKEGKEPRLYVNVDKEANSWIHFEQADLAADFTEGDDLAVASEAIKVFSLLEVDKRERMDHAKKVKHKILAKLRKEKLFKGDLSQSWEDVTF